jgi:hypothetical protein
MSGGYRLEIDKSELRVVVTQMNYSSLNKQDSIE